jgi:pimeloyl-ACP methyl ester carboxylesterase
VRQKRFKSLGVSGFHTIAYTEWGDPENPHVLICLHGLCRNGRDFDRLAGVLARRWRVVCPDMAGRGGSDWLPDGKAYALPTYMTDCAALIARLGVEEVSWLGTSMGGIIGIHMAALSGTPIRRLIVNDVGPFIPAAGLRRIIALLSGDPRFADDHEAERYFRRAMAQFGISDPEDWRHMVETGTRPAPGGGLRLHYDPAILSDATAPEAITDVSFWRVWDAVSCPVLVLRGSHSDILLPETVRDMKRHGPPVTVAEVEGCGHAPALLDSGQIGTVSSWLTNI